MRCLRGETDKRRQTPARGERAGAWRCECKFIQRPIANIKIAYIYKKSKHFFQNVPKCQK